MTMDPATEYGTGMLHQEQSEQMHPVATAPRRPAALRWGAVTLAMLATVGVLLGFTSLGMRDQAPMMEVKTSMLDVVEDDPEPEGIIPPTAVEGAPIQCWESALVDGKTAMMQEVTGLEWKQASSDVASTIRVDPAQKYQEIIGFGGAFTEASALQFQKLSKEKQKRMIDLYFDKETGSGYQLGRVPMGSCDFSVESYNYDPVENDTDLVHFDMNMTHDSKTIIPLLQAALKKQPNLKLMLAPWSPPAWMKAAQPGKYSPNMTGSAKPNGLKPEVRAAWALYFSKFITAYKQFNVPFWGLTPQNEPEFAAPWEACVYEAEYSAEFLGEYLGPVIKRDHPELKILFFDHNRDHVDRWAKTVVNHPTAKNFVDGIAFHWYDGERFMDGVEYHEHLNDTHAVLGPSQFMLATEACNCPGVATGKDAWFRAQRYAHDIITDMNNWVTGWIDWNLILDHKGGPNHLGNVCDAPLVMDESDKDFFIQPMYYFVQHFSKFVDPGSRRVQTNVAAKFDKPGDAQLFPRYPSALHACDGSSRQRIEVTRDNKLQVTGTVYCLDVVRQEKTNPQVELVKCIYTPQTWTFADDQIRMDGECLQLKQGSTDSGARITLGKCDPDALWQKWTFQNGVMHSQAASDKCVTAGYAFVQSASFLTPDDKKVTVVLNENTEPAKFALQYGNYSLDTIVPAGAIRTFTWS